MQRTNVIVNHELSPEELAYWEAQIEPEWRRPEREVPTAPGLVMDIREGRRISPRTMAVLQGALEYKRAPLLDPDVSAVAADPLDEVLARENDERRAQLQLVVRRMLRRLPAKERSVLRLRYGIGGPALGVQETAERLGYCRTTVWDIERRGLETLAGDAETASYDELRAA